jgi:hypothetical protein
MSVGENPYKIINIVNSQMEAFREKYHPILNTFSELQRISEGTMQVWFALISAGYDSKGTGLYFLESTAEH